MILNNFLFIYRIANQTKIPYKSTLYVLKTSIFSDIAPSLNISTLHQNYLILNNYCYSFVFII